MIRCCVCSLKAAFGLLLMQNGTAIQLGEHSIPNVAKTSELLYAVFAEEDEFNVPIAFYTATIITT